MEGTNGVGVPLSKIHVFDAQSGRCHFCHRLAEGFPGYSQGGDIYASGQVCERIMQPVPMPDDPEESLGEQSRRYLIRLIDTY